MYVYMYPVGMPERVRGQSIPEYTAGEVKGSFKTASYD